MALDRTVKLTIGGGAPAYISSMSPYQVKALAAVSNGSATMRAVTPSTWNASTPYNDDILRPWSGGFQPAVSTNTALWVHGGGHADSANNGIYKFDLAGTTQPTGWTLPKISPTSAVVADSAAYSDGLPDSVHTYGGMCECGGNLYRFCGVFYGNGNFTNATWRYNVGANTWTRLADAPFGTGGVVVGNPTAGASGKLLGIGRYGGSYTDYAFYDIATNAWSGHANASNQWPSNPAGCYRPTTSTTGTVLVGGGDGAYSATVDWSAGTLTAQTSRSIGAASSQDGPAMFYDSVTDRFWCLGGNTYNSLLEINPSTWATTGHTLTGDAMTNVESGSYVAHFGRFMFHPAWRVMAVVFARTGNVYAIRLP